MHSFNMQSTQLTISELASDAAGAVRATDDVGIRGITRHGRTVAFLVSRAVMESILETMELQKNPELMALVKADQAGKVRFRRVPNED
jgi:hypothetical protein